jgi:hypothetical protein
MAEDAILSYVSRAKRARTFNEFGFYSILNISRCSALGWVLDHTLMTQTLSTSQLFFLLLSPFNISMPSLNVGCKMIFSKYAGTMRAFNELFSLKLLMSFKLFFSNAIVVTSFA